MMLMIVFRCFNQALKVISMVKSMYVKLGLENLTKDIVKWCIRVDYNNLGIMGCLIHWLE